MDIGIYAGYIVIWMAVWAAYYVWAQTTGIRGLAVYLVFLAISGAASVAYYGAVSLGFSAWSWIAALFQG